AEVGERLIPIRDNNGVIIRWVSQTTNKGATNHFWGWHTSPVQREDLSVTGHVLMQGTQWIFPQNQWVTNQQLCQETDQAFQLLTAPIVCPQPVGLTITLSGATVNISWPGGGFMLQSTAALAN